MKLLRVDVEHFACIRKASVELGPGLNVLYGPNDLGKSTLAQAIRAALLLQHTSSAADAFSAWGSDEQPQVRVTLEVSRRFWQVEKRFGTPATSLLRESKDGVTFTVFKKGREVDEEIRSMLGWGIAAPGGAGAPRGLPPSFLATLLLGEQADVAGILQATLEADSDNSGRTRLTAALEAFAQDPLFKTILDQAQARVDAAFTPKGRRKSGQASPFRQVTEDVKRMKDYLDDLARRVAESNDAAQRLEDCQARLSICEDGHRLAIDRLAQLRSLRTQLTVAEEAERQLAAAQDELGRLQREVATLSERQAALREMSTKLETARLEQTRLAAKRDEALQALRAAEDAFRRAQSDDVERERQIRQGELEKERLELQAAASRLRNESDAIAKARNAESLLRETGTLRAEEAAKRDRLMAEHDAARTRQQETVRQLEVIDVAARLLARRRASEQMQQLEKVRAESEADRIGAREKREAADALKAQLPEGLPTTDQMDALRALRRELDLAEARLGGGLMVAIERLGENVAIEMIIDGAARDAPTESPFTLEGERTVALRIGDIAKIAVSAGEKTARAAAKALAERWRAESEIILNRAGMEDFEALTERAGAANDMRRRIEELNKAASGIEERVALRETQLVRLPSLQDEVAALDLQLSGARISDAENVLDELGTGALDDKRAMLRATGDATARRLQELLEAISGADKTLSALDERLASTSRTVEELSVNRPLAGWEAAATSLEKDLGEVGQRQEANSAELASLIANRTAEVQSAQAVINATNGTLQIATASLSAFASEVEKLQEDVFHLEGEVKVRRDHVAQLDVDAAQAQVDAAATALAALPKPDRRVDDAELDAAEKDIERTKAAYEGAKDESRKAEGALETVGGQVVREAEETAKEALRLAEQREQDVELDYAAWRLLVEKLREAENTEGQHLGEALSLPITERFAALTGGRYGKLEMTPHLRTEGVRVAGAVRPTASLSLGLQEQLATLLRLTVAEHLGSLLVLDDHLTQTDPARSKWFVDVLRAHADKAQIVVLTCRPLDYVREEDLPGGETAVTRAGGLVRVVDLSRAITRSETSGVVIARHS